MTRLKLVTGEGHKSELRKKTRSSNSAQRLNSRRPRRRKLSGVQPCKMKLTMNMVLRMRSVQLHWLTQSMGRSQMTLQRQNLRISSEEIKAKKRFGLLRRRSGQRRLLVRQQSQGILSGSSAIRELLLSPSRQLRRRRLLGKG